jgi:hypothetical protein
MEKSKFCSSIFPRRPNLLAFLQFFRPSGSFQPKESISDSVMKSNMFWLASDNDIVGFYREIDPETIKTHVIRLDFLMVIEATTNTFDVSF